MEGKMDKSGKYIEKPFLKNREIVIDVVELGLLKHHVKVFIDIDVTLARQYIQKYKEKTGSRISFTGWTIKCISQAVDENKQIHALRKGKKKVIIFDDVDVLVTIEKTVNDEKIPLPYIVRKANEKSLVEINDEIRNAQALKTENNTMVIGRNDRWLKLYQSTPKFMRKIMGILAMRDPFFMKKNVGTVGISSIGMMGNFHGWAMPISPQPLYFSLGGITKKPGVVGDKIEIREFLSMSFLFDHDIIDGAPVVRFTERLIDLMENAFELTSIWTKC
jgi:pyruvate/2-oxoglutarate dehydrogenase complex dihydrolipoamide acyltransferase (E2) component